MMVCLLFIIDDMGLFFYNKIDSIISIGGGVSTTNIIEPFYSLFLSKLSILRRILLENQKATHIGIALL